MLAHRGQPIRLNQKNVNGPKTDPVGPGKDCAMTYRIEIVYLERASGKVCHMWREIVADNAERATRRALSALTTPVRDFTIRTVAGLAS